MVVTNNHRTTAIVIRYGRDQVTLVPMKGGKLFAETLSFDEFRESWSEVDYALEKALDTFLAHAQERGASAEVVRGLVRLQQRDLL
ncbi:MAG TPA: hypothetical protein VMB75_11125, partial [Rhodocyclaceae bacterium]|nr:hypothetical protein [Rhodocyclaceae bacterium]